MPTEYSLSVLPHDTEQVETRLFSSQSIPDLIEAVHWMIESLPTEMDKANARVGIMLSLRHTEEVS